MTKEQRKQQRQHYHEVQVAKAAKELEIVDARISHMPGYKKMSKSVVSSKATPFIVHPGSRPYDVGWYDD
jgi:hypothetical protein